MSAPVNCNAVRRGGRRRCTGEGLGRYCNAAQTALHSRTLNCKSQRSTLQSCIRARAELHEERGPRPWRITPPAAKGHLPCALITVDAARRRRLTEVREEPGAAGSRDRGGGGTAALEGQEVGRRSVAGGEEGGGAALKRGRVRAGAVGGAVCPQPLWIQRRGVEKVARGGGGMEKVAGDGADPLRETVGGGAGTLWRPVPAPGWVGGVTGSRWAVVFRWTTRHRPGRLVGGALAGSGQLGGGGGRGWSGGGGRWLGMKLAAVGGCAGGRCVWERESGRGRWGRGN